jgi:hypothetical protein
VFQGFAGINKQIIYQSQAEDLIRKGPSSKLRTT